MGIQTASRHLQANSMAMGSLNTWAYCFYSVEVHYYSFIQNTTVTSYFELPILYFQGTSHSNPIGWMGNSGLNSIEKPQVL